ncbi:hypothetical protein C8R44DRAFT_756537 [Mycena epipterygia]|nr:hypothetical protein C8R44DRAFT_756537 [Mycena epipterygia]
MRRNGERLVPQSHIHVCNDRFVPWRLPIVKEGKVMVSVTGFLSNVDVVSRSHWWKN